MVNPCNKTTPTISSSSGDPQTTGEPQSESIRLRGISYSITSLPHQEQNVAPIVQQPQSQVTSTDNAIHTSPKTLGCGVIRTIDDAIEQTVDAYIDYENQLIGAQSRPVRTALSSVGGAITCGSYGAATTLGTLGCAGMTAAPVAAPLVGALAAGYATMGALIYGCRQYSSSQNSHKDKDNISKGD